MSYDTCINCAQEVTDPTNPSEEVEYVHVHTFEVLCHPDDLAEQGLHPETTYSACPVGEGEA